MHSLPVGEFNYRTETTKIRSICDAVASVSGVVIGACPSPARHPRTGAHLEQRKTSSVPPSQGPITCLCFPEDDQSEGEGGCQAVSHEDACLGMSLRPSVVGACYQMACSVADPPPLSPLSLCLPHPNPLFPVTVALASSHSTPPSWVTSAQDRISC